MSRISIRLAGEKPGAVLLEQLGSKASRLEFAQMLLAQALVRGEQNDAVQLAAPAVFVEIELVLQDVGVHQQRLAAAGRAPIGDLVDLRPGLAVFLEGRNVVGFRLVGVARGDLLVDRFQQRVWDR